jgi:hypothetical protein
MMHQFLEEEWGANRDRIEGSGFLQQAYGKLKERQKMNVQQRGFVLDAKQPLEPLSEGSRRNDDRERGKWVCGLDLLNVFDQRQLKVGMKGPGDDPEHAELMMNAE